MNRFNNLISQGPPGQTAIFYFQSADSDNLSWRTQPYRISFHSILIVGGCQGRSLQLIVRLLNCTTCVLFVYIRLDHVQLQFTWLILPRTI